jgi:hypothetical protein
MTASEVRVTNLTPPGSECQPCVEAICTDIGIFDTMDAAEGKSFTGREFGAMSRRGLSQRLKLELDPELGSAWLGDSTLATEMPTSGVKQSFLLKCVINLCRLRRGSSRWRC